MSTISSYLKLAFKYMLFVGFYVARGASNSAPAWSARFPAPPSLGAYTEESKLEVGPYQGPLIACGLIDFGAGVCGSAAATKSTQIVDDVKAIENYIACDDETQSEIVVPVLHPASGEVHSVLDIDSEALAAFDATDKECLEALVAAFVFPPQVVEAAMSPPPSKRQAVTAAAGEA